MKKGETKFWGKISMAMSGAWDAQRHEDKISLGIPDVSFGFKGKNGWIELKYLEDYPKKESSPIRIKHFTPEQKIWLEVRQMFGGNCWVLIGISKDIYLFKAEDLTGIGVNLNRNQFMKKAFSYLAGDSHISIYNWLSNALK